MALTSTLLHSSKLVRIRHVACSPHSADCGDVECSQHHSLVLPLGGVFLKHLGRGERVVCDRQHILFFRANRPYRVSHPLGGGDTSLVFDFEPQTLREVLAHIDARAADREEFFSATHGRLNAHWILRKHRLASDLRLRQLSTLEAQERALELLAAFAPASLKTSAPGRARRTDARRCERVEATMLTLSGRSGEAWTLPELARRVHCSPWHLARQFRRVVGMPLHQFQLVARLAAALDHVLDTNQELAPLAADLGFASHSHFTASFRRLFGCTPTALRTEIARRIAVRRSSPGKSSPAE